MGSSDISADLLKKYDRIALVDVYTDIAMPWVVVDGTTLWALRGDRVVPTSVLQQQDKAFLDTMMTSIVASYNDVVGSKAVVLDDTQRAILAESNTEDFSSVYAFQSYVHQAIYPFGKKSKKQKGNFNCSCEIIKIFHD